MAGDIGDTFLENFKKINMYLIYIQENKKRINRPIRSSIFMVKKAGCVADVLFLENKKELPNYKIQ